MAAGGNRNALNREVGADGLRDWSFGLFDCTSECGLCCWATWCPCVVYSKDKQRFQHLQIRGTPLPGGGERFNDTCCIYGCLLPTGYAWVLNIDTRTNIRGRYSIRGGYTNDSFTTWCCHPCSLTQERREIELEENSFGGLPQSK
ncbi:PLAC8 family-domain-containing protein [Lactarius hatsudake]|nr:PLAC8 family-domain-containing protein [Lactarius hatsudake]KAH8990929.1 PLAC8 family-domain-containing protein [Lactarius hatsudake]